MTHAVLYLNSPRAGGVAADGKYSCLPRAATREIVVTAAPGHTGGELGSKAVFWGQLIFKDLVKFD